MSARLCPFQNLNFLNNNLTKLSEALISQQFREVVSFIFGSFA
jgi:hypothetical protein